MHAGVHEGGDSGNRKGTGDGSLLRIDKRVGNPDKVLL